MEEMSWWVYLIGGGGIVSIVNALISKFKTKTEKAIDKNELSEAMAEAMQKTLEVVQKYYKEVLDGYNLRLAEAEAKINRQSQEKKDYNVVVNEANKCRLLRENPGYECPVISANISRLNKNCSFICNKENCHNVEHTE